MTQASSPKALAYLPNFTARKVQAIPVGLLADVPDSLAAWATRYLAIAVVGVRSEEVTKKIALHLDRFVGFFLESYDHNRISACLRRDVLAWQKVMVELGLAPAQVRSLKNLCDRLERFHRLKGQRWAETIAAAPVRAHGRSWRDREIVYVLLSTGLRREEILNLNLDQLVPKTVAGLRQARQGRGRGRRALTLTRGSAPDLHDCAGGEPHAEALEPEPPPAARYWSKVR